MKFKSLIRSVFRFIGFELRRIPQESVQDCDIHYAIKNNTFSRLNEFYSDKNRLVIRYLKPDRLRFYQELLRITQEEGIKLDGKSVVDVGCGTGHFLLSMMKTFTPQGVLGLEYSTEAIKRAREFCPEANFEQHNIYEKYSSHFDIVFCMEVLEHLEHPDIALRNLFDMVDIEGVAIVTVPNGRIDTLPVHINFWSPESWHVFVRANAKGYRAVFRTMDNHTKNLSIIFKN